MKKTILRYAFLIAVLLPLLSCGNVTTNTSTSDSSDSTACTPNGNLWLFDNGGNLLTAVTVTAIHNVSVPDVTVSAGYSSQTAGLGAGYAPGATDPRTVGMNISQVDSNNPMKFSLSFDSSLSPATYKASWRFVTVDSSSNMLGCQDLPVTFTIN